MTKEHRAMESIAEAHDARADDIFGDISNGTRTKDEDYIAQAHRRCAEIIRYQIECEA